MPRPLGDRLLIGFRVLDDANRIVSEIWMDPAYSRVNINNLFPTGEVMEAEEVSLQEFMDMVTSVHDRRAAALRAHVPARGTPE